MKVYTCTLNNVDMVELLDIPWLDVTVKSGDKTFAPTWDFLMEYKKDKDEQKYVDKFIPLMRESYKSNTASWMELINKKEVALACYCRAGQFCHRHLLVDILEKLCNHHGINFERGGEL
ncbi:protein of unknown function DUF488 [Vibrio phage 1.121.O._10N.286.46.C4]|nr:protein of unknown function DUF488 [Vibrio phage 1.121.O._10N.286.46.C4]